MNMAKSKSEEFCKETNEVIDRLATLKGIVASPRQKRMRPPTEAASILSALAARWLILATPRLGILKPVAKATLYACRN